MSVTIVDFKERKNSIGEPFNALILQGEVEMIKSRETGNYYATARRTSITSTFSEQRCKQLIGTTMPGKIKKVSCPAYDFTIPETGEVISLEHTYEYVPEDSEPSMEDEVFERKAHQNGELSIVEE